jgi:EAL domain-containing protein (putative c-di-GMP-specific phosphodiesterase class I)
VVISVPSENGEGMEMPPMEFLQAAENYNRIYLLDRWIIDQLIQWLASHETEAAGIRRFILRLSGRAISDDSLLDYLRDQAYDHDIPMDKFCFELNETATIHDLNDAAEFMHELRKLGCKFVLSDFGTGQSSYNFLKQLPVDFVKIDRNFIDGLRSSSADYALIKSIQEIAQFMAKKTIAEHSENELTWDILRGIGIDFGVTSVKQAIALEDLTET